MSTPRLWVDVIADADLITPCKQMVENFSTQLFRAPQAIVRNVEVAQVDARRTPVTPELGDVVQGYLGGKITDLQQALIDLSDANSTALDQAIEATALEDATVAHSD